MPTSLYPNLQQIIGRYMPQGLAENEAGRDDYSLKDIIGCLDVLLICIKHPRQRLPKVSYEFIDPGSEQALNRAFDVLFNELTARDN